MDTYGEEELPVKEMVEKLMTNTEKDDESLLPHIFPPEREYNLSSIFVDTNNPLVNLVSVPLWFRKCETYIANFATILQIDMTMNVVGMFELLLDTSICKVYVVKFVIFLT